MFTVMLLLTTSGVHHLGWATLEPRAWLGWASLAVAILVAGRLAVLWIAAIRRWYWNHQYDNNRYRD